jgi:hypothetical protein
LRDLLEATPIATVSATIPCWNQEPFEGPPVNTHGFLRKERKKTKERKTFGNTAITSMTRYKSTRMKSAPRKWPLRLCGEASPGEEPATPHAGSEVPPSPKESQPPSPWLPSPRHVLLPYQPGSSPPLGKSKNASRSVTTLGCSEERRWIVTLKIGQSVSKDRKGNHNRTATSRRASTRAEWAEECKEAACGPFFAGSSA